MTRPTPSASPVNCCPACRDGAMGQRQTYGYASVYLCGAHRTQWDAADDAAQMNRPMTPEWPNRIMVAVDGRPMHSRVLDAETGISLPNTKSVNVFIGAEGFIEVTVFALVVDGTDGKHTTYRTDEDGFRTFERVFILPITDAFDFTCEAATP